MLHGVIVADKPEGPTSHDVVAAIRRWVRPSKAGHTGTLDPMATGVLPVCIGLATRLARFLSHGTKQYEGTITLGSSTDTYDARGEVTNRGDADGVDLPALVTASAGFTGEIDQVPPMWSAKRIDGHRAYKLAREGKMPTMKPGRVTIDQFLISALDDGIARFKVTCSPGTYIRSLAHDLGNALGCYAHLGSLRRIKSGSFTAAQAHRPEAIESALQENMSARVLIPMEDLDLGMPTVQLLEEDVHLATAGRLIAHNPALMGQDLEPGQSVRLLAPSGRLVGIAETSARKESLQPRVILASAPPGPS
jgi:tRNA pseudouridine55 synthase